LLSWKEVKGVQPSSPPEENEEMADLVKTNPEVLAALKRRGITDLNTVFCSGYSAGYFGKSDQGHRLFHFVCAMGNGPLEDGGPVEGLNILWDATDSRAVKVTDSGVIPLPKVEWNYNDRIGWNPARRTDSPRRAATHGAELPAGWADGELAKVELPLS